jgi:hypothetical protein
MVSNRYRRHKSGLAVASGDGQRESATGRRYFLRRVSYGKAVTGRQYRKYDTRDRLDSRS